MPIIPRFTARLTKWLQNWSKLSVSLVVNALINRAKLSPHALFDADWYSKKYLQDSACLEDGSQDPYRHFMNVGWKKGYNPNPFFDVVWYQAKYAPTGNPLIDYIRRGPGGRRNPHPLFNTGWYLSRHPDVVGNYFDALVHFLHFGRYEGRAPNALFDSVWYAKRYTSGNAANDPFLHYLEEGIAQRYDPHPLFDANWYIEKYSSRIGASGSALAHFLEKGAFEGCAPHPLFDAEWYFARYNDVAVAKVNPLIHYLMNGASELRDPHPHFQTSWYLAAHADVAAEGVNPLVHFVSFGMAEGRKPNFLFDPQWYARNYQKQLPGGTPAFLHFLKIGRFVGLQPSPYFSAKACVQRYGKSAGFTIDPAARLIEHARSHPESERHDMGLRLQDVLSLSPCEPPKPPQTRRRFIAGLKSLFGVQLSGAADLGSPRIAVQIHFYYPELASKFVSALRNIPFRFDLFISIPNENVRILAERAFAEIDNISRIEALIVENRGRDIAPFVVTFGARLAAYDLVLHLHTKRSPHNSGLSGWLDYLLANLLGGPENVAAIIQAFETHEDFGILFPTTYDPVQPYMRIGASGPHIQRILPRLGFRYGEIDPLLFSSFPSGSMVWMRGAVMAEIDRLGFTLNDFDDERGQDDGTLAHAIERLLPIFARKAGFNSIPFARGDGTFDDWCGMWRAPESVNADVLILDHSIGGGANKFVEIELQKHRDRNEEVVRLYQHPTLKRPAFEHIVGGVRRFYVTPAGETMGRAMTRFRVRDIVVNSLYGLDRQIGGVIAALERAKQDWGARVRVMTHDFYLACPSQHLLDATQHYCGLPAISSEHCRKCVDVSENIDAQWRDVWHMSTWRLQSQALLDLSDEVRFFDESGNTILSQVLEINPETRTLVPHVLPQPLRPARATNRDTMVIGIFGTLQFAKGIDVVNRLAAYIRETGSRDRIIVIGGVIGALDPSVRVHGPYATDKLPEIVETLGVNVAFLSSVVPETFCYTLSEAMDMRLPVLGFDLGAQGSRLKSYDFGRVLPLTASVEEIYATLAGCWRVSLYQ